MMKRNNAGFTLIELMMSIVLLTGVSMALYYINLSMTKAVMEQQGMTTLRDDGRITMQYISRRLRNAESSLMYGVNGDTKTALGTTPVTTIEFQTVTDTDGNGNAINTSYTVELGSALRFGPDTNDKNGDGESATQLVQFATNGNVSRILTNFLDPSGGISFVRTSGGVQISLKLLRKAQGIRPQASVRMDMVIDPRN
jgi:prepilin-type N-terminal cleavage/methylation domain-containing protein